jgi:hypothetical protein
VALVEEDSTVVMVDSMAEADTLEDAKANC